MTKNDKKKLNKNVKLANKILFFSFYAIVLLVLDIICVFCFKPSTPNYLTIISLDIGIGLFFAFLMMIKNKVVKNILFVAISLFFIFYILFEFVEIAINKIVGNVFTFSTITFNIKNVFAEYADDVKSGLSSNIIPLSIVLILMVLFVCLSRIIYFGNITKVLSKKNDKKRSRITNKKKTTDENVFFNSVSILITFIVSVIFLFVGVVSINKNVFDFESNMKVNGLKVAIVMDAVPIDYTSVINDTNTVNDIENLETESISLSDSVIASDSETMSIDKPYFYDTEEYNVINFDFDEIISKEDRPNYNAINEFIKQRLPSKKNEYTGLFKGKNLIMICAEAWNSKIVDKELFPAMYRLLNNGFKFNNFYQPRGSSSTSSGEYAFMTGMIPVYNDKSFVNVANNNMGFTIPKKMKDANYHTNAYHNGLSTFYGRNETHGSLMGFDSYIANDTGLGSTANDTELIKKMYEVSTKESPFFAYVMTYSGHKPYDAPMPRALNEYYLKVNSKYKNRYTGTVKKYIAKNLYLEEGLEYLLDKLEENNLINDTVICMVPDHFPYGLINASGGNDNKEAYLLDLYKDPKVISDKTFRDKTQIILWSGSLENDQKSYVREINKVTNTIDLTPTLLNLFGLEFDSRLYPGRDVFSDFSGMAIYQNGMFINDNNVVLQAVIGTNKRYSAEISEVHNLNNYCKFNILNDYYGYLINNGTKQKTCYLTFDGGPTKNTRKILEILKEKNVKATFFVTGAMDMSVINDIVRDKHTLGIQSYYKNYNKIYRSDYEFINDFNMAYSKVSELYRLVNTNIVQATVFREEKVKYIRFYGGSKNEIGKKANPGGMERAIEYVNSMGLNYVDWNVDSGDGKGVEKEKIIENVLKGSENLNDICVLLHDDIVNDSTVEALPELIEKLEEKGYRFKNINNLSPLFHK